MFVTRLKLKNWRNFRDADLMLREFTYVLGANASGKSNLLDAFRFLRDLCVQQGGGLQKAVADRGGIKKLRCLHARRDPEVKIEVHFSEEFDASSPTWIYVLAFKPEGKGAQRILVSEETVKHHGKVLFSRPNSDDRADQARLTQTHLEQIQTNSEFRQIAEFFAETTYLHLVPQLLKYADRFGGSDLLDDPFGQSFLKSLARSSERVRSARLKKIEKALVSAVPQFKELQFDKDELGRPHLKALYSHHRPNAGWQNEDQFSDGTLRLIGMLWALLESNSLLLLEEPELSLNDGIVEQIPLMMQRVQRESKRRRQVIITTHSDKLLSNTGIDALGVVMLEPGPDGTKTRPLDEFEKKAVLSGLSIAEVALPKTRPPLAKQLAFWN
jgi:predicted ATPase